MKSVFIDSSVFFTATNSPTGGSAKLFTLANIKLLVSPLVLTETERNVRSKLHSYQLQRFFKLAEKTQILNQKPDSSLIIKAKKVIAEKDAVILAEAKMAKCDLLVTLDKKDFLNEKVARFLNPSIALTPKDLIELLQLPF
jgi:predicted nucleic acid-binding protein